MERGAEGAVSGGGGAAVGLSRRRNQAPSRLIATCRRCIPPSVRAEPVEARHCARTAPSTDSRPTTCLRLPLIKPNWPLALYSQAQAATLSVAKADACQTPSPLRRQKLNRPQRQAPPRLVRQLAVVLHPQVKQAPSPLPCHTSRIESGHRGSGCRCSATRHLHTAETQTPPHSSARC